MEGGGVARDPGGVARDPTRSAARADLDPTAGETAERRLARAQFDGEAPIATRPITADPGPLGLAGFAMTTCVLSVFNAGWLSDQGVPVVLGLALAYGGIAQLLAGMWEFRTGNTFGAVAFTSYGAFWISFWALEVFYAKDIKDPSLLGNSVGLYLLVWGFFTAYMFIASLRVSVAIMAVFGLLTLTFVLLGIGQLEASTSWTHAGGYAGIVTAFAAWYASFAAVVNATFGRTLIPVIHLNR